MNRIYVAGALSGDALTYLENMRKMFKVGYKLLRSEIYAPFVPALDYQLAFAREDNDKPFAVEEFYRYSMAWLAVADAVLVLPNYAHSKGTLSEIQMATELDIPIFYNYDDMHSHFQGQYHG